MAKLFQSTDSAFGHRVIVITGDLHPESLAMLSALYSRDPSSVLTKIEQNEAGEPDLEPLKSADFMNRYYVGYGHNSIGDCGSFHVFFENISQHAAIAITHNPLFKGQESSTRYLDFSKMPLHTGIEPSDEPDSETIQIAQIQERWMEHYQKAFDFWYDSQLNRLMIALPAGTPPDEALAYRSKAERQARAFAFDKARGLLPAGVSTNVVWHADLRNARDHLHQLKGHYYTEVESLADQTLALLHEAFPNSGFNKVTTDSHEEGLWAEPFGSVLIESHTEPASIEYNTLDQAKVEFILGYDQDDDQGDDQGDQGIQQLNPDSYDIEYVCEAVYDEQDADLDEDDEDDETFGPLVSPAESVYYYMIHRQRGERVPACLGHLGVIGLMLDLDFGNYRDLHRHRAQVNAYLDLAELEGHDKRVKLAPCYLEGLPQHILDPILLLADYLGDIVSSDEASIEWSYAMPMGRLNRFLVTLNIPQLYYLLETRSAPTVHQGLRDCLASVYEQLTIEDAPLAEFIDTFPIHADFDREDTNMRRGGQTIEQRTD